VRPCLRFGKFFPRNLPSPVKLYYLLRTRNDGRYLTAQPQPEQRFLLLFNEAADALSYLNTHAGELSQHFAVETITHNQVTSILQRWGFQGFALVEDPLLARMEFFKPT
jgi:hypothetical protein